MLLPVCLQGIVEFKFQRKRKIRFVLNIFMFPTTLLNCKIPIIVQTKIKSHFFYLLNSLYENKLQCIAYIYSSSEFKSSIQINECYFFWLLTELHYHIEYNDMKHVFNTGACTRWTNDNKIYFILQSSMFSKNIFQMHTAYAYILYYHIELHKKVSV